MRFTIVAIGGQRLDCLTSQAALEELASFQAMGVPVTIYDSSGGEIDREHLRALAETRRTPA